MAPVTQFQPRLHSSAAPFGSRPTASPYSCGRATWHRAAASPRSDPPATSSNKLAESANPSWRRKQQKLLAATKDAGAADKGLAAARGGSPSAVSSSSGGAKSSRPASSTSATAAAVVAQTAVDTAASTSGSTSANNILPAGPLLSSKNFSRYRCLVVDCTYRPVNVVNWLKAVMLDWNQRAEVLEYYDGAVVQSGQALHQLPAVLRVPRYVDLSDLSARVTLSRRNVMTRDRYACVYCASKRDLTIDHVTPKVKGGRDAWDNLVTACNKCNQAKGHKTLAQMGWRLKVTPREPSAFELGIVVGMHQGELDRVPQEWEAWVEPFRMKLKQIWSHRDGATILRTD